MTYPVGTKLQLDEPYKNGFGHFLPGEYKIIGHKNDSHFRSSVSIKHLNTEIVYFYLPEEDKLHHNAFHDDEKVWKEYALGAEEYAKKWLEYNKEWL